MFSRLWSQTGRFCSRSTPHDPRPGAFAGLTVLVFAFVGTPHARAEWINDGVALCTAANHQEQAKVVSDGEGGAIVTWQDSRSGTPDIYVQRVNAAGVPQWTLNGVALCVIASTTQAAPLIASDGAGGAIVTWIDVRGSSGYDIYVQRVNAAGVPQWTPNGVALCTAANDQGFAAIASDGAGGAIVTWVDDRLGFSNREIYAQRVNSAGVPQWTPDGVALCSAVEEQFAPTVVSDGVGGAIAAWQDLRSGSHYDIYAQRVNATGVPQWTADGVALCAASNYQTSPTIVTDGTGGAIVSWVDERSGADSDIYAQRVNAAGVPQWTSQGVVVSGAANDQFRPTIVSDGGGGVIVAWEDIRNGSTDIYAQRVNASGGTQWTSDGVPLCSAVDDQSFPAIASDVAGGAIVTWQDNRTGALDVWAQRVNGSGASQWTLDGLVLCNTIDVQSRPSIVSDGAGGAIVTWQDKRTDGYFDIYAQDVKRGGDACHGAALCTAVNDQLNPTAVSDGAGGAIVCWEDLRSGGYDLYAQRVNAVGAPQWTGDGVALCTGATAQLEPQSVSDGAGGAIVAWQDQVLGTGDIYAQRVNAAGVPQWTSNGVLLCGAANHQSRPQIVPDGAGGAIVCWQDLRSGTSIDIYAQRVNAAGVPQWTVNGVALCVAPNKQEFPRIDSDGASGAIVTWEDSRGGTANVDIYAQRVDAAGVAQWTSDGVALCAAVNNQLGPKIISDGAGGAIVTWVDLHSGGTDSDLYAQRVNGTGVVQWAVNGVALCTAANKQTAHDIISDGANGAIVAWADERSSPASDIYLQRINGAGGVQWTLNGRAVCTAQGPQFTPRIAPDGAGGGIVAWADQRSLTSNDIFAQRFSGSGGMQWAVDGLALCYADNGQGSQQIVSDGLGGAIVVWSDLRSGSGADLYVETADWNGASPRLGVSPLAGIHGSSVAISGRDFDTQTVVKFNGTPGSVTIHSATSLTATVPVGATAGPIEVLGACGSSISADYFYPPGWSTCGVPVSPTPTQEFPVEVPDGSGGVIIAWQEARGTSYDVYAQRMNANGQPLWPQGGVALCSAANDQLSPAVLSDGAGGAFVAWDDARSGNRDVYIQRVNAAGVPQWTANGVPLSTTINDQYDPRIETDGAGGVIVTWHDLRSGPYDVYAQRVNPAGVPLWTADGVALSTAANNQVNPEIVSDGVGGAIVTWRDYRSLTSYDVYAQRVNAAGVPQWTANGVALCTAPGDQYDIRIESDGAGGAIATWHDLRSGPYDVYAQRVNPAGVPQWIANGVAIAATTSNQVNPDIASDGAGGAIIAWRDYRNLTSYDIYAQRVNGAGVPQWTPGGVALCTAANDQGNVAIASDGAGGAIVTWVDNRTGASYDIYSQRVNAAGIPQWTANGQILCNNGVVDLYPVIAPDGVSGAIVTFRNGSGRVDAVRVRSNGLVTGVGPFAGDFAPRAWPNPFREQISIAFSLPTAAAMRLEVFDIAGRRIWASPEKSLQAGRHTLVWDGRTESGQATRGGLYFMRLRGPEVAATRTVVRLD